MELGCRSRYTCGDLCRPTSPYLLHPYSKTKISTDATMDPARPTRFEKKKNMLPNVPHVQQFQMWTWSGSTDRVQSRNRIGQTSGGASRRGRKLGQRNFSWGHDVKDCLTGG